MPEDFEPIVLFNKTTQQYEKFKTEEDAAKARAANGKLVRMDSAGDLADHLGTVTGGAADHFRNPNDPNAPPQSMFEKMKTDPRYSKTAAAMGELALALPSGFSTVPSALSSLANMGLAYAGTNEPSDLLKLGLSKGPAKLAGKLSGAVAANVDNPLVSRALQTLVGAGAGGVNLGISDLVDTYNHKAPKVSPAIEYAKNMLAGGAVGAVSAQTKNRPNVKFGEQMHEFLPPEVTNQIKVPMDIRSKVNPAKALEEMAQAIRGNVKANPEGVDVSKLRVARKELEVQKAKQLAEAAALKAQGAREKQIFKDVPNSSDAGQDPTRDFFTHTSFEKPSLGVPEPTSNQPPSTQQVRAWQRNISENANVSPEARQRSLDLLAEHAPDKVPPALADRVTFKPPVRVPEPTGTLITDEQFANKLSDAVAKKAAAQQSPLPVTPANTPAMGGDVNQTKVALAENALAAERAKVGQSTAESTLPYKVPTDMSPNEEAAMNAFHSQKDMGNITSSDLMRQISDPKTSPETISGLAKVYGQEHIRQGVLSDFLYRSVDPTKGDLSAGPKAWADSNMDLKLKAAFGDTQAGQKEMENFQGWYNTLQKAVTDSQKKANPLMYVVPSGIAISIGLSRAGVPLPLAVAGGASAAGLKMIDWPSASKMMLKNPGMLTTFQKWVDGGASEQMLTKMPALRLLLEKNSKDYNGGFGDQGQ